MEQDIDLALRNGPLADSALKARLMLRGHRLVCAAPSYWKNRAAPSHSDDRAANILGIKQATLSRKLTALDRADVRFIRPQYPNLRRTRSRPIPMGLCAVSGWREGCRKKFAGAP